MSTPAQSQPQNQTQTSRTKNGPLWIVSLLLIVAIASAVVICYQSYQTREQLIAVTQELESLKLAALPNIEKSSITSYEQYFATITSEDFCSNYRLNLNSEVLVLFRDSNSKDPIKAGSYGSSFPIAYIEKNKETGKHAVCFAVQHNDSVRYMYVFVEDLAAQLPRSATGSFVKVS